MRAAPMARRKLGADILPTGRGKAGAGARFSRGKDIPMNQLNSILLEGNLVKDPQVKETPKGTPVCEFAVASNRYYKQGDDTEREVSFFDVETWSLLAQKCGGTLKKGRGVRVVGRLKQDRWTGTDGKAYAKIKIVADHVEFKPEFKGKDGQAKPDAVEAEEAEAKAPALAGAMEAVF
jgi:single-strand DNA-binding protein